MINVIFFYNGEEFFTGWSPTRFDVGQKVCFDLNSNWTVYKIEDIFDDNNKLLKILAYIC